jgi:hypothetical protein
MGPAGISKRVISNGERPPGSLAGESSGGPDDFLLRNVGYSLRLVLSSRTDPPLPLHRYRLARRAN